MSEGIEARLRHHGKDTLTQVYAGDMVEVLDTRDAIIAAQADIIRRYSEHFKHCYVYEDSPKAHCSCGYDAALAALRKLQGE